MVTNPETNANTSNSIIVLSLTNRPWLSSVQQGGGLPEEPTPFRGSAGIDGYVATRKMKHGEPPGPCPRRPLPTDATPVERMARKLQTKAGATIYATRSTSSRHKSGRR